MIEKRSHVLAHDPVHGQQVFVLPANDLFEKTASITKEAQVSDVIAEAIENLKAEPGHRYVLVNGIGAGEFWGSNRNGDYFPEGGLKHAGEDYGFRTFLSGHNFLHHENKDPLKAVGTVKCAHYNQKMHRVELLLDTDLAKLAKADPEIYEKVANGEPVDVSMGSKCDFDVCSLCSHRAATRAEYCAHLKTAMNQITDIGQKAYAYTPHPRFFDISYVTKGADVTAKALHYLDKQASVAENVMSRFKGAECPNPAAHEKVAADSSFLPMEFPEDEKNAVALLERVEPTIPFETLSAMAKVGFNASLSTCSHLGIVLKPEEYQAIALVALGHEKVAASAFAASACIDPSSAGSWFDPSLKEIKAQTSPENVNGKIAELLCDFIADRTILQPYFTSRIEKISRIPSGTLSKIASQNAIRKEASSFMTPELAVAMALGYLIYRKGVPGTNASTIAKELASPEISKKVLTVLMPIMGGAAIVDRMLAYQPETNKTAGIGMEYIAPIAGTYLYSAHAKRKAERGEPISGLEHMALDYPLPLALGAVGGIKLLKSKIMGTMAKSGGIISDMQKRAVSELLMAMGSGFYRPRPSGLIGYTADAAIASGIAAGASKVKKLFSKKPSEETDLVL
jgi:hypothetical protein